MKRTRHDQARPNVIKFDRLHALPPGGNTSDAGPVVLTVQQAADLLQVSRNSLYNLVAQRAVPYVRFGKLIRIPRWGLLDYIARVSGAPLAPDDELAPSPAQSVHVTRPEAEEE